MIDFELLYYNFSLFLKEFWDTKPVTKQGAKVPIFIQKTPSLDFRDELG